MRYVGLFALVTLVGTAVLGYLTLTRSHENAEIENFRETQQQTPEIEAVPGFVVLDDVEAKEPIDIGLGPEVDDEGIEQYAQLAGLGPETPTDTVARARQLQSMFMTTTQEFGEKLEIYILHDSVDSEWSPVAATILDEQFRQWTEDEDLIVDCVSDMCMLDLSISFMDFHTRFVQRMREQGWGYPEGFLPASFYFNEAEGIIRIYFFRDTFDPALL